jgi:hypothetical protein
MTTESKPATDRAYPYWAGWHVVGCAIIFFGLLGSIAVALLPAGYERVQTGDLPTGIAMMVMGLFGVPTLAMSVWSFVAGVRDTVRPPLLRVTADALLLPAEARGEPPQDEYGEPTSTEPPHPAAVPLATVKWVKRGGPPLNPVLLVAHDGAAQPLELRRNMMSRGDFDDLEATLRAALPAAFLAAPPDPPST